MRVKESEKLAKNSTFKKTKIMASRSWQIKGGKVETVTDFIFLASKISDCSHEIKRCLLLGRKAMTNLDSILKSEDIILPTKLYIVNWIYDFSSSYVWMWELDYKEDWTLKNWCFQTVVIVKTLESPFDCKENKLIMDWCWSSSTLPPVVKSWLNGKDPNAGKDWGLGEKGDCSGWDGWIASPTQWTWVWAKSGR